MSTDLYRQTRRIVRAAIAGTALLAAGGLAIPANAASPTAETRRPGPYRIAFFGNSITHHGPSKKVDWSGNWGMAASEEAKDYVHVFLDLMEKRLGARPDSLVKNIVPFERNLATYDQTALVKECREFQPDLIVFAIGENVPKITDEDAKALFQKKTAGLLNAFREGRNPTILVRSCFWANPPKDEALAAAAKTVGATYVDLSALKRDENNYARSEREYSHKGVAAHPGDRGMRAIAEALLKALPEK